MPNLKVNVSIVAANYNNSNYLESFIDSILNSTVLPKQIILVDDASTDNSIDIVQKYNDVCGFELIKLESNVGLAKALNFGIEKSESKYILRADPDDIFHPQRIEVQYNFMERNPDIDILGSNVCYFSQDISSCINKSNFPLSHKDIYKAFSSGLHGVQHPTTIIKSEILKRNKYKNIRSEEDYELFARLAVLGYSFRNLKESLYFMRVHKTSHTSNLKLKNITNTFNYRDELFKTRSSKLKILFYFLHIRFYRKYQFSKVPSCYFYLFLSSIMQPSKIFKRLIF